MEAVATAPPSVVASGTTIKFTRTFPCYSAADGWSYAFYLAGATTLNEAGVPDGAAFDVTLAAATTAAMAAGTWRYSERVTKAGEVVEVGCGVLEVKLDLATAADGAAQSHEEKTLVIIEAALSSRLTKDQESYQIEGRAVTRIPIEELERLRGRYASRVYRQRNRGRLTDPVSVVFRDV